MITTAIIIYIVSAYLMWRHTKIAYSKYGRWWNLRIRTIDLIFCFIPAVNTLSVFVAYVFFPPLRKDKRSAKRDKNKSLFERIQYFLSKGKKFAPRETHFH